MFLGLIWEVFTVVANSAEKQEKIEEELEDEEYLLSKKLTKSEIGKKRDNFLKSDKIELSKYVCSEKEIEKPVNVEDISDSEYFCSSKNLNFASETDFQNNECDERNNKIFKQKSRKNIENNNYERKFLDIRTYQNPSKIYKTPFKDEILEKGKFVIADSKFVDKKLLSEEDFIHPEYYSSENSGINDWENDFNDSKSKYISKKTKNITYEEQMEIYEEEIFIYKEKILNVREFCNIYENEGEKLLNINKEKEIKSFAKKIMKEIVKEDIFDKKENKSNQTQKSILKKAILKNSDLSKMKVYLI